MYCLCCKPVNKMYNPYSYRFLRKKTLIDVVEIEIGNDYCYASLERTRLVFVFQGSDDLKDWINNLRTLRLEDRDDCHEGFYDSAKQFRDKVTEIIEKYKELNRISNPNIIVCGHSRGGALAKEVARHIAKRCGMPCDVFTYGSPRIGGSDYRDEYLSLPIQLTEVVNGGDPVPRLPSKKMGFVDITPRLHLPFKFWHIFPWMWIKVHTQYDKPLNNQKGNIK